MQIELTKIDTDALKLGMFVSKLDRPWLDTPFLLQGFPIKTIGEINALKKYCSYVYIDVEKEIKIERGKISNDSIKKILGGSKALKEELKAQFSSSKQKYNNQVSFTSELPNANKALKQTTEIVCDAMVQLHKSGKLNISELESSSKVLMESALRNCDAITWLCLMKKKDDYIYRHSVSSSIYAFIFGRHLGFGLKELEMLGLGAMLLDIGKTKVPDNLLHKHEPLSEAEQSILKSHVEYGLQIIDETQNISPIVRTMIETHHERHDGSGYMKGLSGKSIPIFGRIAGIVDSFDAMTSERPYAKRVSTYECLRTMNKQSDKLFQKELVEQFIQAIGFFPTGTLVELNNGSVGVVVSQNISLKLKPEIMIILDENKKFKDEFKTIALEERKSLWITKGLEPGCYGVDPTELFLDSDA